MPVVSAKARLVSTRYYFEISDGRYVASGSVTFGKTADGRHRVEVYREEGTLAWTSTGISGRGLRTARLAFETWYKARK